MSITLSKGNTEGLSSAGVSALQSTTSGYPGASEESKTVRIERASGHLIRSDTAGSPLEVCASVDYYVFYQSRLVWRRFQRMVTIIFPDRTTEKRALAFLLGRFSGRVLRSGEHLVPEAALEALADQNIPFTVKGKTTYEQQMAAIRGAATPPVQ
jgi:hypothetical protein